jgi:hypothetical protein
MLRRVSELVGVFMRLVFAHCLFLPSSCRQFARSVQTRTFRRANAVVLVLDWEIRDGRKTFPDAAGVAAG